LSKAAKALSTTPSKGVTFAGYRPIVLLTPVRGDEP
jgi:hypothetical protein